MAGTIAPFPKHQFFTDAGAVAAGYQLFTYAAGTTVKQTTYSDVNLSTANANPIILDSAGRATIFLDTLSYKFTLAPPTDTDPPASALWSVDNIAAVPSTTVNLDITGTAGHALAAGDVVYLSAGDGSRTAGRWYKADADNDYSSSIADALGVAVNAVSSGSSGTIRLSGRVTGLSGLTIGSLYYISATAGAITTTAPTNYRAVGAADSATSLILGQWVYPSNWNALGQDASATLPGRVNLSAQTLGDGKKHFKQVPTFDVGSSDPSSMTMQTVGRFDTYANGTGTGNTALTETVLYSATIAANSLDANDMILELDVHGTTANTGSIDKQVRVRFGTTTLTGTVLFDTGAQTVQDQVWVLRFRMVRLAAGSQYAYSDFMIGAGSTLDGGTQLMDVATGTESFTVANLLEITGVGTNANDVRVRVATVRIS